MRRRRRRTSRSLRRSGGSGDGGERARLGPPIPGLRARPVPPPSGTGPGVCVGPAVLCPVVSRRVVTYRRRVAGREGGPAPCPRVPPLRACLAGGALAGAMLGSQTRPFQAGSAFCRCISAKCCTAPSCWQKGAPNEEKSQYLPGRRGMAARTET